MSGRTPRAPGAGRAPRSSRSTGSGRPAGSARSARSEPKPSVRTGRKAERQPTTPVAAEPRRRTSFTGRAAILAVVIGALAIALAAPARQLFTQRSQISTLRTTIASQQSQIAALNATKKQLSSSAYIAAQAADRLHYVFPGQVPYVTLSPTPLASASAAAALANDPWYARLWSSVEGAAAGPTPLPTPSPTPALASSLVIASEQALASQEVVASESALEAARTASIAPQATPTPAPLAGP